MINTQELLVRSAEGEFNPEYGYEVYVHRGVAYSKHASGKFIQAIESFPVQPNDVFLAGTTKAGTNWLDIMVANLYDHWGTTKISRDGIVPELSLPNVPEAEFDGLETGRAAQSPRLMKSHLPYDHMPHAFQKGVGRAVYITRNPKDVCDSAFNQFRERQAYDWDGYVGIFAAGKTVFGAWLDHVLSWHDPALEGQVLHVTYEDLRRDIYGQLRRITNFLGPVTEARLEKVITDTEFSNMMKNGLSKQIQPWVKTRTASVGKWKDHFTVAQSELFDRVIDAPLRAKGIRLTYEF